MVGKSGKEITHELRGRRDNDTAPDPLPGISDQKDMHRV